MATAAGVYVIPEEYLAQERKAEFKSEYYRGQVTAMAGGSYEHSVIIANVIAELHQGLRGTECTVSSSDVRLAIASARLYTYPDVMVVCGDPVFLDNRRDTLSNPTVIVEVLSESTKDYDRGQKFQSYRTLPSLMEYLTIAQDALQVEQWARQPDGRWLLTEYSAPDSRIRLTSTGTELQLSDLYEKVEFEAK
jgi:Uma2 family endonuclease